MAKKTSNTHHVTYDKKNDDWKVIRGNADRASGRFDTKEEAVRAGREVSRNQGTELKIHNQDGKISQSDSHGRDPYPPRG
jgi:hypothetical protein